MVIGRNNGLVGLTGISDMKLSGLLFASQRSGCNIGMVGLTGWSYGGVPLYRLAVCVINFHTGIKKQASDSTYAGQSTYAKGHLLPAETYSFTDDHSLSTFTYTNAVPQITGFNSGLWAQYERKIREYARDTCSPKGGDLYLITGISEVSLQNDEGGGIQEIPLKVLKPSGDAVSIPRSM